MACLPDGEQIAQAAVIMSSWQASHQMRLWQARLRSFFSSRHQQSSKPQPEVMERTAAMTASWHLRSLQILRCSASFSEQLALQPGTTWLQYQHVLGHMRLSGPTSDLRSDRPPIFHSHPKRSKKASL